MSQPYAHTPYTPFTHIHPHLALPSAAQPTLAQTPTPAGSSSASTPRGLHLPLGATNPKKRKANPNREGRPNKGKSRKSGVNDSRELDERDDVKDDDLVASPGAGGGGGGLREVDDNYDEGDEEDGAAGEEDGEEDGGADVAVADAGVAGPGVSGGRNAAKKTAAAKLEVDVDGVLAKGNALRADQAALHGTLTKEELARFDSFSSLGLPAKAIKKLLKDLYDQSLPDKNKLPQYLGAMGKVFIAELIEAAKDLQPQTDQPTGPLRPYHLKLARQVLEERGLLGSSTSRDTAVFRPKKALFRR